MLPPRPLPKWLMGDLEHPGYLLEALLVHVIMRAHRVAGLVCIDPFEAGLPPGARHVGAPVASIRFVVSGDSGDMGSRLGGRTSHDHVTGWVTTVVAVLGNCASNERVTTRATRLRRVRERRGSTLTEMSERNGISPELGTWGGRMHGRANSADGFPE